MTDSQIKYQQIMENQRHNLEMERLTQGELEVKQTQAATGVRQAEIAQQQAQTAAKQADISQYQAETQRLAQKDTQKDRAINRLNQSIWKGTEAWNSGVSNALKFISLFF